MPVDSDVALIGTGVAPLIAAGRLAAEGKSVLILNPDWDFFRENAELPLDPLCPVDRETVSTQRLLRASAEFALTELRPEFPGAIELWPEPEKRQTGFHDPLAPHVRSRARLWIDTGTGWDVLESMYLEAADAGLNPQLLDGLPAARR